MLPLITGIVLGISTVVFLFYGSLAVKHATRFRYLSNRTVTMTVLFIGVSTTLFILAYLAYAILLLN